MSSGEPVASLRERKRQATRERLIGAALELFGSRGYQATTMDDIAAGADVSRATAFNYFPRKEEFLLAYIEQRRAALRALITREQAEEVDTVTRLEHAFRSLGGSLEADPDTNRPLLRAWVQSGAALLPGAYATAEVFADTLRYGQARGDLRSDVDASAVGRVLVDAYMGAVTRWAADDSVSLKTQLSAVLELISRALRPS